MIWIDLIPTCVYRMFNIPFKKISVTRDEEMYYLKLLHIIRRFSIRIGSVGMEK